MENEIISLLKSPLADDRKKGIQMAARSDDPDTLKVLAALIKKENDPEIKEMALKTGRALKKRLDAGGTAPVRGQHPTSGPEQEAQSLMSRAMDAVIDLDYDEAQGLARKAYTLYPDLVNDDAYRKMFADVFGTSENEAIAMLMAGRSADDRGGQDSAYDDLGMTEKPKRKRKIGEEAEVSWGEALLDVGIYGLFSGGLTFLFMLFIIFTIGNTVDQLVNSGAFPEQDISAILEIMDMVSSMGLGLALGYGIAAAIGAMIGMMLVYAVVHFGATTFLGGNGTYTGLLHRITMPMLAYTILSMVLSGVGVYVAISAFGNLDSLENSYSPEVMTNINSSLTTIQGLNLLLGIGFTLWLSSAIGSNYKFGMGRGCISIILGYILLGIFACGCVFVFSSLLIGTTNTLSFLPIAMF